MKRLAAALAIAAALIPLACQAYGFRGGERERAPRAYPSEGATFRGERFAPPVGERPVYRRPIAPPPPYGWRRGQILAEPYRGAVIDDFGRYHLRRPPPGYFWYRSGDNFVLAARASGMIFEVIPADGY